MRINKASRRPICRGGSDEAVAGGNPVGGIQEAKMSNVIDTIRRNELRSDLPEYSIGDTIRCGVRISEGGKTRIQNFEGVVMARRGTGTEASLMVRKISSGIAVERIFPIESPNLASIEVIRRGKVRRAKLYYLRELTGKKARIRERQHIKK